MFKIPKQEFTAEFKELAVKRVKAGHSFGPNLQQESVDFVTENCRKKCPSQEASWQSMEFVGNAYTKGNSTDISVELIFEFL